MNSYSNIPGYYKTMYLDGYELWQVWGAAIKMRQRLAQKAQEEAQEEAQPVNVHVTSEVRVKR